MDGKWDLTYLYTGFDDPRFQQELTAVPDRVQAVRALLTESLDEQTRLERIVDTISELTGYLERLLNYVELTLACDANDALAAQYDDKLSVLMNDVTLMNSAVTRHLGSVAELDKLIAASPKLTEVRFILKEMAEDAHHLIPESVEPWMLTMQLSGGKAFSQLRDKLDSTHTVDYRGESLPLPAVRGMAYDADPDVRKDAYEAELASYKKMELPMAYCLNSIKMEARTLAKAHGYDSVLDWTLATSRMDRETLDAMWTAIREYLPDFRRYLRAKAAYLGHPDGLPFDDLFAPVGSSSATYTAEEAHAKLVQEMGKFTPDMADFMDYAFRKDWIDLYPREGKTGGAFCASVHSLDQSRILTNFQGSFSDVSTLAHELGHAWHARCMKGLNILLAEPPMPLAETASIFNETMLCHQVLSSATKEEQFAVLEGGLMESTQTVVDIYSRFLFESEVVDTRADHAMTVDELKDAMLRAQEAAYGDGLAKDVRHPYMWACKSHYYSSELNFYNFPYAFGLLFGKGVFAQYLARGSAFVADYNRLLRSCGSDTIANVAASVGIDVHSVDFWRSSLEVVKADIDSFCRLCAEQ